MNEQIRSRFQVGQKVRVAVGAGQGVPEFFDALILSVHYVSDSSCKYIIRTFKELRFISFFNGFSKQIFIVDDSILGETNE